MAEVFRTYDKNGKPHSNWRYRYKDRFGKMKKSTGLSSKKKTEELAQKIEESEKLIRLGVMEPPKTFQRKIDINLVLDEYLTWGKTQGGRKGFGWSKGHLNNKLNEMKWWTDQLNLNYVNDLNGCLSSVEKCLQDRIQLGNSNKTVEQYAESITSFCNWCVNREYLEKNPLLKRTRFNMEPKRIRRNLTIGEIKNLISSVPKERKILYTVALCSGLRANELKELTKNHLDPENGGLKLEAQWTKNRSNGFQILPELLVKELQQLIQTDWVDSLYQKTYVRNDVSAPPKDKLLYVPSHTARTLDIDLKKAGIQKVTDEGVVDFHALRVSFCTLVNEIGANPKQIQTLSRHAEASLTYRVYTKNTEGSLKQIVNQLYELIIPSTDSLIPKIDTIGQSKTPISRQRDSIDKKYKTVNSEFKRVYDRKLRKQETGFEPATFSLATRCSTS